MTPPRVVTEISPEIGCATMLAQAEGLTVNAAVVLVGSVPKQRT